MTIVIIAIAILVYMAAKYAIERVCINRKMAYCNLCKYRLGFIYGVCQEDCYHPRNMVWEKNKRMLRFRIKDYMPNQKGACKYFRIDIIYSTYLTLKVLLFNE